jgi:hypothetical protein
MLSNFFSYVGHVVVVILIVDSLFFSLSLLKFLFFVFMTYQSLDEELERSHERKNRRGSKY